MPPMKIINKYLWKTEIGRSLPLAMQISVSPSEKADPQIHYASGRDVPEPDAHRMKVSGNLRPTAVTRGVVHE